MLKKIYRPVFANDFSPMIPQWWARETLRILDKKLRILPFVDRNYEPYFKEAGDVVNVHRVSNFTALRKQVGSPITMQNASATGDTVKLNQQVHVAFSLTDMEMRSNYDNLRGKFLNRAAVAMAEGIDKVVLGELYQMNAYAAGHIGTALGDQDVLDLREHFNRNELPEEGRVLFVGAGSETELLAVPRFVDNEKIANGQAIVTGQLGMIRGFRAVQVSQAPEVSSNGDVLAISAQCVGAYLKGATAITCDTATGTVAAGAWCLIAGDDKPHRIVSKTDTSSAITGMVISPPLFNNVADNAVITILTAGQINYVAGYAVGYSGDLVYDTFTINPAVGQGVTIGNNNDVYTIIAVDIGAKTIRLNRPLDNAAANDELIHLLPRGKYCMALGLPDAITFVNRPLPLPDASTGVKAAYVDFNGIALRVMMAYDFDNQTMKINFDTLCGVKSLNRNFGGMLVS